MRVIYLLLSISALLLAGTYSATMLWPNYFAEENHQPLDSIADEIISNTELGLAINRSLDSVEAYLKNDSLEMSSTDRERLVSLIKTNKENYRAMMKENMKGILLHSLTREELIEVNQFYRKDSGKKFSGILSSPEEKLILSFPWRQFNQFQNQTPHLTRAPASASTPAPSPSPSRTPNSVAK